MNGILPFYIRMHFYLELVYEQNTCHVWFGENANRWEELRVLIPRIDLFFCHVYREENHIPYYLHKARVSSFNFIYSFMANLSREIVGFIRIDT